MFKVEQYLLIAKKDVETDSFIIEDCDKTEASLSGLQVVLPKEKLPDLLVFVESELQNPTYVYNLLNKNTVMGMNLLANMLKLKSYTCEFIKVHGGVQEILDLFKPAEEVKPAEIPSFVNFGNVAVSDSMDTSAVVQSSSNIEEMTEETDTVISDSIPEVIVENPVEPQIEDNFAKITGEPEVIAEDVKTEEVLENSHKEVVEADEASQLPMTKEMSDMMLMVRAMAVKMGIIEVDSAEVMNLEDLQNAKLYLNELAATTVRDGVIAVLDRANSREELEAVTTFMAMFISYMKEV